MVTSPISASASQLLQVQSVVETLGRQLEEETKELEVVEEKLEMERMEKVFLEEQAQSMEMALLDKSQQLLATQAKLQVGAAPTVHEADSLHKEPIGCVGPFPS